MDDVVYVDDELEADGAIAAEARPVSHRVRGWIREFADAARGAHKLAGLYFCQTGLIFPGRSTQGMSKAEVADQHGGELVRLRTRCGEKIVALFGRAADEDGSVLADASDRPTMMFFYGNQQHLANKNLLHVFDGLRRIGVNVLIPEYVGYGLSTGEACEAGCYATADAAYRHLLDRDDIDPSRIVAAGASLGGAVAIDLASRKELAGLITLITFTSMVDMAKVIAPDVPIWRFIRHKFESERKMPDVNCPALIIHSTGDELVPYSMADRLARACQGDVTRVKVDGAGHSAVEMLEGGRNVIYGAMTDFLART